MSGYSARQWLLLAPIVLLLAACQLENRATPRQSVVEWPENRLLFIADERSGAVQAFYLGNGAPVRVALSRQDTRQTVRDMKLDARHGQLWVLGQNSVDILDARGLALHKRIPLDARDVASLRMGATGATLLAANGETLGDIDTARLIATWQPPRRVAAT